MDDVVAIIPAYEPDSGLPDLVRSLSSEFCHVIIIDDGSRRSSAVFKKLCEMDGVSVLVHTANRGKGAALKTAFAEIIRRFPEVCGAVTVDADGQHLASDVIRVAKALRANPDRLTLGVRTFGPSTPFRSKLGNLWTRVEFLLLTGCRIRDTQTGLRGIPADLLSHLLTLPGDRYEYEIRMLVDCCRRLGTPVQVPISTVYPDGNTTSHFRPFADTVRTQRALFASACFKS